jgi:hypothetical protein
MELLNFKTKTIQLPLPNRVVSIGQDVLWNVNKHRITSDSKHNLMKNWGNIEKANQNILKHTIS